MNAKISNRQRRTRQFESVQAVFKNQNNFLSAADIYTELKTQGSTIGLATIYRNLAALAADGILDQIRAEDGTILYRECSDLNHHHHLRCRHCGATEDFTVTGLEKQLQTVAKKYGFTDLDHIIELSGLCAECANK